VNIRHILIIRVWLRNIRTPVQWTERRTEQTEKEKTRNLPISLKWCSFIWFVNHVSVTASVLFFESLYPRPIIQRIHPCILDFKLSPCSECCMFSSESFLGVWILYADVSEHCLFHLHRQVGVQWLNLRIPSRGLCGSLPLYYLLCNRTHPYSATLLTIDSGYFRAKTSPVGYPNYSQI